MKLNLQQKKYATEDNFRKIISIITGMMSSVDDVASQCLKDYNPDETYTRGQICLYDNYLWLCKTVTTGAFEETKWEKQTDNITELDLDTIKTFLGLTPEQLDTMANLISTEIRLDKVFSSSETYTRIDNALKEAKQYCVSQLAQKSTGSFKTATSVAEVTDGNYLYLIMNDDTSKYDIYALVDENVEKLTTVEVNLDNYFTKSEIEAEYLKKEDADGKYATITTVDDKVDKTDIVDNLTSTDTDKPLSANQGKILNDTKLNKTDANKLNCVTIDNVSLKEYILTNFTGTDKTYYLIAKTTCTDLPKASNFYITVETPGMYTYKVTAKELNDSNGIYVCTYRAISSSWTAWEKVCTTTVADVPVTYINTFENETYVRPINSNVCSYYVTNGFCVVKLETICLSTTANFVQIISGLPKPKGVLYSNVIDRSMGSNSGAKGLFQLVYDGTLRVACDYGDSSTTMNRSFYVTFSYPVAE